MHAPEVRNALTMHSFVPGILATPFSAAAETKLSYYLTYHWTCKTLIDWQLTLETYERIAENDH